MTSKLEQALGPIKKSNWEKDALKRSSERAWKKKSQEIAIEILEYLDQNKISQKQFATKLNVSPQLVNKWVRGSENFTLETISKLEEVMGVELIKIIAVSQSKSWELSKSLALTEKYPTTCAPKSNFAMYAKVIPIQTSYNYKSAISY